MLFVFRGKLAARQSIDPDDGAVGGIADIERGEQIFRNAEDHIEQVGTRQGNHRLASGDHLMITDMHAGGNPAEGGGETHLRQLFTGNFQGRVGGIAIGALHVHLRLGNRLTSCQGLETIKLTLGEGCRRLSLIDPLLGFAGIQTRQRLSLS